MTDFECAKAALSGHTIALCKGSHVLTSDKKGVAPMIDFIDSGIDLNGYSVADLVVGKAVAMLYVKAGIVAVYARTISASALSFLQQRGIAVAYEILTDKIINRKGDGICPMEKLVRSIDDVEIAYGLIKSKLIELQQQICF